MLSLNAVIHIPAHIISTTVDQDAVLLNTKQNKYYALDEVGARFWHLLSEEKTLNDNYMIIQFSYT